MQLYVKVIVPILDILFSSNQNVYKSSCGLQSKDCKKFYRFKGLKPKNKGHKSF